MTPINEPNAVFTFKVEVPKGEGGRALRNRRRTTKSVKQQISALINETLDKILRDAQKNTPVSEDGSYVEGEKYDPGNLKASGVKVKRAGATEGFVAFGDTREYGGTNAPYAVYVHENWGHNAPYAERHPRGGKGKFLERAALKAKPAYFRQLKHIFKSVKNWQELLDEDMGSGKEPRADVRDSYVRNSLENADYGTMRG